MTSAVKLPICVQASPYELSVEAGQLVAWCTCGLSQKQPLCDGAHKGTDFRSHKIVMEDSKVVYLCGCKQTKNPPFCDGSHNQMEAQNDQ